MNETTKLQIGLDRLSFGLGLSQQRGVNGLCPGGDSYVHSGAGEAVAT